MTITNWSCPGCGGRQFHRESDARVCDYCKSMFVVGGETTQHIVGLGEKEMVSELLGHYDYKLPLYYKGRDYWI